jgi:hypothetical protein
MTSTARKIRSVSRAEAEAIVSSGLTPVKLWLWCAGVVLVPTLVISVALALMT